MVVLLRKQIRLQHGVNQDVPKKSDNLETEETIANTDTLCLSNAGTFTEFSAVWSRCIFSTGRLC